MNSELMVNIVATGCTENSGTEVLSANGEMQVSCQKKSDSTMPDVNDKQGTTQCAPAECCILELAGEGNIGIPRRRLSGDVEKIEHSVSTLFYKKAPAFHSQSSASQLLPTIDPSYFSLEVIGKNRTQHKSWRSGACMENTNTLSMLGLYTAPAFLFTKQKSRITNIIFNIARQMSSFGGTAAQEFIGGIRGNIDAFTGWRIRNNEGKAKIEKTGTTEMTAKQNGTERTQNSGIKQQRTTIQEIAPALLFLAITNHILYEEAKQ